jgi:hypothetical protein
MQTTTPTANMNPGPHGGQALNLLGASLRTPHPGQPLIMEPTAVARLRPYGANARTHSKKQIRQIADSIQKFGFTNLILRRGRDHRRTRPGRGGEALHPGYQVYCAAVTWAGLSPAGSQQLCLAHLFGHLVGRTKNDSGMVRFSASAILRLMTS